MKKVFALLMLLQAASIIHASAVSKPQANQLIIKTENGGVISYAGKGYTAQYNGTAYLSRSLGSRGTVVLESKGDFAKSIYHQLAAAYVAQQEKLKSGQKQSNTSAL